MNLTARIGKLNRSQNECLLISESMDRLPHLAFLFPFLVFPILTFAPTPSASDQSSGTYTGNSTIQFTQERIVFSGFVPKYKTSDPRSLGGAIFLTNSSSAEYRVTRFFYSLDETGLLANQSVETDVGLTILSKDEFVALDSGKEMLVTHQFDAVRTDRGIVQIDIPPGGFALSPGQKLSVGSVSAVSSHLRGDPQIVDDEVTSSGQFLRLQFTVELTRADLIGSPSVTSYRSPFRDRAYVADPLRTEAPSTDFKNESSKDVNVYALSVFFSDRPDSPTTIHKTTIFVNEKPVRWFKFSPHQPGISSERESALLPIHLTLKPGEVVSVRGGIISQRAVVFDFASYLIADAGLSPFKEQLNLVDADLSGNGHTDIVDIDSAGSVWVSLRSSEGLQNTQLEWARDLRFVQALHIDRRLSDGTAVLRATNSEGLCLNLHSDPYKAVFIPSYCGASLPSYTKKEIWGDFNGDGWIDRMKMTSNPDSVYVALGGPTGLQKDIRWSMGDGAPDRAFVSHTRKDARSSIEAEWNESSNFKCAIWKSTGSSFVRAPCNH